MKPILYLFFVCFMLSFGLEAKSKTRVKQKHKNKARSQFFRFLQKKNIVNSAIDGFSFVSDSNSNSVFSNEAANSVQILKEGWLRVSSINLFNTKKYPNIPLEKKNFAKVEVIRNNQDNNKPNFFYDPGSPYRKNSHFGSMTDIPSADSFWFRVSGAYLYYTESKADMIVLGAISVESIVSTTKSNIGSNCFRVDNMEKDQWDLCTSNDTDRQAWVCAISQAIGRPCGNVSSNPLIIEEKRIVKQPILLIPLPSPYCNENWNYSAHGGDWNCKCSEGFMQSPINVQRKCVSEMNITTSFSWSKVQSDKLEGFYDDNMFVVKCREGIEDCEEVSFGKMIDMDYAEYSCNEIRFHTPGEHTIDGRKFSMEIQLIYHPTTEGDYKKKAAVAFLVDQVPGKTNEFFDFMEFLDLPNIYKRKMRLKKEVEIDVERLFIDSQEDKYEYNGYFNYWRYDGSLTSPPCDEHVRWFIVEKPVKLGYAAMEMMKDVLKIPAMSYAGKYVADLRYPPNPDGNNRDIQPARDRPIYYFDMMTSSCVPLPRLRPQKGNGHYEKVTRKVDSYVYIDGDKPSGISGAFVVPSWEAFGVESPEEQRERDIDNTFRNTE